MSKEQIIRNLTVVIGPAVLETLIMVLMSVTIGSVLGFIIALLLTLFKEDGLKPNKWIFNSLSFLVNTIRSFPGLILIVSVTPLTKLLVGSTLGIAAAVVPLSISCTFLVARLLEDQFRRVDAQLIEAAHSFGASNLQILMKVIVHESVPAIISTVTLASINMIAMSTIAGTVGAGGVGSVALNYGFHSFNNFILYTCVFILFILVQLTQSLGNYLYKKFE